MSVYQKLFDKLDATIEGLENNLEAFDTQYEEDLARDAVDLLKRLGIVAASLLNGSVQAFSHLILEPEPAEQTTTETGNVLSSESDGDEEGQEPPE